MTSPLPEIDHEQTTSRHPGWLARIALVIAAALTMTVGTAVLSPDAAHRLPPAAAPLVAAVSPSEAEAVVPVVVLPVVVALVVVAIVRHGVRWALRDPRINAVIVAGGAALARAVARELQDRGWSCGSITSPLSLVSCHR